MNTKRHGRKADFPNKGIRRMAIILPEEMAIKLDVHAAKSILSRNQIVHEALKAYLGEEEK